MMDELIVSIRGTPVYVGALPSGDIKVWHPHNDTVRSIVEPICRGKGYWRVDYNNWIVFRRFKHSVLRALRAQGRVRHG